jgi:hypothetical protein
MQGENLKLSARGVTSIKVAVWLAILVSCTILVIWCHIDHMTHYTSHVLLIHLSQIGTAIVLLDGRDIHVAKISKLQVVR